MHIIHKATENFLLVLSQWTWFITGLKHVCRLLSRRHSKTRLLEPCFQQVPQCHYQQQVRSFNHQLNEERWGTVLAAIANRLPLMRVIRHAWDRNRYMAGGSASHDKDNNDQSVKADLAHEVLVSDFWWAFMIMLDQVAEVLLALVEWAESCPCHYKMRDLEGKSRHHRSAVFRRTFLVDGCPLRTMQAAYMASGEAFRRLQALMEKQATSFSWNRWSPC